MFNFSLSLLITTLFLASYIRPPPFSYTPLGSAPNRIIPFSAFFFDTFSLIFCRISFWFSRSGLEANILRDILGSLLISRVTFGRE